MLQLTDSLMREAMKQHLTPAEVAEMLGEQEPEVMTGREMVDLWEETAPEVGDERWEK